MFFRIQILVLKKYIISCYFQIGNQGKEVNIILYNQTCFVLYMRFEMLKGFRDPLNILFEITERRIQIIV